MKPLDVINRARSLWYVAKAQYWDDKALEDLNVVYKMVCMLIIQNVDENYFSDFITTTLIAGQNEYVLEDETNWIKVDKIGDVFVKYSSDWEYIKCERKEKATLSKDLEWYNETQSQLNPFYFIYDKSIFIYPALPAGDDNVVKWIKLNAALTPIDLLIDWIEDDILLESAFHYILAEWMLPLIYQRRGLLNEKQAAQNSFDEQLTEMLIRLSDRTNWPTTFEMPNLSYFE